MLELDCAPGPRWAQRGTTSNTMLASARAAGLECMRPSLPEEIRPRTYDPVAGLAKTGQGAYCHRSAEEVVMHLRTGFWTAALVVLSHAPLCAQVATRSPIDERIDRLGATRRFLQVAIAPG